VCSTSFCGALAAHLRPGYGSQGLVSVEDRLRASLSGVLVCWVAFAAAGFAFYKTTEDAPFARVASAHLILGASHFVVQALAAVASLAIPTGGLPIADPALSRMPLKPALNPRVKSASRTVHSCSLAHGRSYPLASGGTHRLRARWAVPTKPIDEIYIWQRIYRK
jgi:hypothetical protein